MHGRRGRLAVAFKRRGNPVPKVLRQVKLLLLFSDLDHVHKGTGDDLHQQILRDTAGDHVKAIHTCRLKPVLISNLRHNQTSVAPVSRSRDGIDCLCRYSVEHRLSYDALHVDRWQWSLPLAAMLRLLGHFEQRLPRTKHLNDSPSDLLHWCSLVIYRKLLHVHCGRCLV